MGLSDSIVKNKSAILASVGVLTLISYLLARRRKKTPTPNKLYLSLDTLLNEQKKPNIKKIVITESPDSTLQIRHHIVEELKIVLANMKIKVLVNCSPQKLLRAGCSSFIQNVGDTSSKLISFYESCLKTQLIIEKTIMDIDLVTRQDSSKDQIIVMICDNNIMDIKVRADERRWSQFLVKNKINEQKLMESYDLVLHIISDKFSDDDIKITQIWKQHGKYLAINAEGIKSSKEKAKEGLNYITGYINQLKGQSKNELLQKSNVQ